MDKCDLITSAAALTLNQIKCNLDRSLLDKRKFTPNLEPSSLTKAIQSATNIVELQAKHRGINLILTLSDESDTPIMIDSLRVQQIIINLL